MSTQHSHIRPNVFLFLRLSSETLKLIEIKPNTIIEVGKLGSFPSNLLLGRPYHVTYELLEKRDGEAYSRLRIVPASELHAETVTEDDTPAESKGELSTPSCEGTATPVRAGILGEQGLTTEKNNRLTVDLASRQTLSQGEIEELKKSAGGKEIIEKILANHAFVDEKTAFSKAKYMQRKSKKYLKRFIALPMEVGPLLEYILEKEPQRIMEVREEALGLICAWSNVHYCESNEAVRDDSEQGEEANRSGRWLVVDDTGGLIVAALAEKMGILYAPAQEDDSYNMSSLNGITDATTLTTDGTEHSDHSRPKPSTEHRDFPLPATTNSLTLVHPAVQPNVSVLKHFGYDTNEPSPTHPLHTHLKALSWLQLLHPEEDPTYREPQTVADNTLQTWKSGKRSMHWRKRRRWERCKAIVDDARAGGFEGLVVASAMDPGNILKYLVPLVRGGGHVVVYSPTPEPLVRLMDLYSKERRVAYLQYLAAGSTPPDADDEFPVDPRLLLAPTLQTSRAREWQVLPGRTHPLMTSRGGAEGYIFTARRVVPLEGGVEARGNFAGSKRRKMQAPEPVASSEEEKAQQALNSKP